MAAAAVRQGRLLVVLLVRVLLRLLLLRLRQTVASWCIARLLPVLLPLPSLPYRCWARQQHLQVGCEAVLLSLPPAPVPPARPGPAHENSSTAVCSQRLLLFWGRNHRQCRLQRWERNQPQLPGAAAACGQAAHATPTPTAMITTKAWQHTRVVRKARQVRPQAADAPLRAHRPHTCRTCARAPRPPVQHIGVTAVVRGQAPDVVEPCLLPTLGVSLHA